MKKPLHRRAPLHGHEPGAARRPRTRGFTLVEVAVSLVLLALASGTVVAVLRQQVEQRKMAETDAILSSARDALLAFVTTYGYLPCPAIGASNGVESVASVTGPVPIRTCTVESGFLPAVTLGISHLDERGLLESAWRDGAGNSNNTYLRAVRYSVASLAGTAYAGAMTSPGLGAPSAPGIRAAVQPMFAAPNFKGLFVCYSGTGLLTTNNRCGNNAANSLAPDVAVILWSLGEDAPDIANYSTDERQNYTPTVPRVVISHNFIEKNAAGGPFDDQVNWISYATIADRLVYGGFVQ
jgi:prepilin-type N-terminal cleavage/methylation domain-containing protein